MNIIDHSDKFLKDGIKIQVLEIIVDNIESHASNLIEILKSTLWIDKLDIFMQKAYRATSKKTIEKLVQIFSDAKNSEISSSFGEYLVSIVSGLALEREFGHERIPISELLKEKVTGNASFDYHTIDDNVFVFGESKYSSVDNPYNDAIQQVKEFIADGKDDMDLIHLKNFSTKASENYILEKKHYSISFSIVSRNRLLVLKHAVDNYDYFKKFDKWYVIGVIIDDNIEG